MMYQSALARAVISAYSVPSNCSLRRISPHEAGKMAKSTPGALSAIDRRILRALSQDGRMTVQAIAEKVGLSASPCLRRIRQLEEDGVIAAYSAVLDQKAVGLPVSVFISIKLERQRSTELDRFSAAIGSWPEVMECYLMTGQFDFLLRVVCADLAAYESFLREKLTQLDGVGSIESSFSLAQIKYSRVLPL
jgi:Lrp/AsnC family leucine-responsive transcriptional regulator